jgi:hypothetical protein
MNLKEFNELFQSHNTAYTDRYIKQIELYENKVIFIDAYDKEFLKTVNKRWDILEYSFGALMGEMSLIHGQKEKMKETCIGFEFNEMMMIDAGDYFCEGIWYEANYYEIASAQLFEFNKKLDFKKLITHTLYQDFKTSGKYSQHIDCKLLTLFTEGKIDWETLGDLVYSDYKV